MRQVPSIRIRHAVFCVALLLLCAISGTAEAASLEKPALHIGIPPSIADTGMADAIGAALAEEKGIEIIWLRETASEILHQNSSCDVDAIITHMPEREKEFVENGFSQGWLALFYSNYLLVGPAGNPDSIPTHSSLEALQSIADAKLPFVSAIDDSALYDTERFLWQLIQIPINTEDSWYIGAPAGKSSILERASEIKGYALVEEWQWLEFEERNEENTGLEVLLKTDELLTNQYNLIILSQEQCPQVHLDLAREFAEWTFAHKTQTLFASFRYHGRKLFYAMDPAVTQ